MLSLRASLAALLLAVTDLVALSSPAAAADGEVVCPPDGDCRVVVTKPGKPGALRPGTTTPAGGGGPRECRWVGQVVPCSIRSGSDISSTDVGWFSERDGCYYFVMDPPPRADSELWEGHAPDGAVYETLCRPSDAVEPVGIGGVGFQWLAAPPPGFGGGAVSPAVLAARAVNLLPIRGAQIGVAPRPGGSGLVGLPVWLWTTVSAATWGPATASASAGGVTVTATARAGQIEWRMGDGTAVTCTTPGTPYRASFGGSSSPDCGHVYRTASDAQAGGRYTVTAVTTWNVAWAGGGQSGTLTTTRQATTTVQIGSLAVVNQ